MNKIEAYESLIDRFWTHVLKTPFSIAFLCRDLGGINGSVVHPPLSVEIAEGFNAVTWSQCGFLVASIMVELQERGVKKGDRIAVQVSNPFDWILFELAIQCLNCIAVTVSSDNGAVKQFNDTEFVLYLCDEKVSVNLPKVLPASRLIPDRPYSIDAGIIFDTGKRAHDKVGSLIESIAGDVFRKRILTKNEIASTISIDKNGIFIEEEITHQQIASHCRMILNENAFAEEEIYLADRPVSDGFERFNGAYLAIWQGWTTIISENTDWPADLKRLKPTIIVGSVPYFQKIYAWIKQLNPNFFSQPEQSFWAIKLLRRIFGLLKTRQLLGGNLKTGILPQDKKPPVELDKFFNDIGVQLCFAPQLPIQNISN